MPPGRVVALDLGERRIGVASSDDRRRVAVPSEVLERTPDRPALHRRIAQLVADLEGTVVVVGVPLSLDGAVGPAARRILAEVAELQDRLQVPVVTCDERFSTSEAHSSLRATGMDERSRRGVVDAVAAAVILQRWLDGRSSREDVAS